jgi:spermidine/putrescine transport system substrate-binding protein
MSLHYIFLLLMLPAWAVGLEPLKLHVYTWADYLNPDLLARFEKEHSCKVVVDTFDSNEAMYARLQAGASGYDVVFPSSYIIHLMEKANMLQALDKALLPNSGNIDHAVLAMTPDPDMRHGVPYTLSYTVIAYRKDKVPDLPASWSVYDRTDLRPRLTLLNDMRETLGAALKFLGHSLNTQDPGEIIAARDVVIRWKRNIAKFENEQYKGGVDSGEFLAVTGYSGDLFQVVAENAKVSVLFPKEGCAMTVDEMVILKTAPQKDLAHRFINFLLDPEVAAENMEWTGYLCPNIPGKKLVTEAFLSNPAVSVPPDLKGKIEVIRDVGDALRLYTNAWDEVKAAP